MGRLPERIDRGLLELAIAEAEQMGEFRSYSRMCEVAAAEYNKLSPEPLTKAMVASRIELWSIPVKTHKRQRYRRPKSLTATAQIIAATLATLDRGAGEVSLELDGVTVLLSPQRIAETEEGPSLAPVERNDLWFMTGD